jgi:hypothetical protein
MAGYSGTPLVKKIGIKPADSVLFIGAPKGFDQEISPLPAKVKFVDGKTKSAELNVAICFTDKRSELEKTLPRLKSKLAQNGMIWVAWPKKTSGVPSDLNENLIRDTGLAIGLVDIKVCAVNEIWSGLKFVIPVKDRKPSKD